MTQIEDALHTTTPKLIHLSKDLVVRSDVLKKLLTDIPTALFFARAAKLNYSQLGVLLEELFHSSVLNALIGGDGIHSHELQDYLVETIPTQVYQQAQTQGMRYVGNETPELLAELFEVVKVDVAKSLQDVVSKLTHSLELLSDQGEMVFKTMAKLNRQRANTIGTFGATIVHRPIAKSLVVFDVSGSMTRETVRDIVDEVVHLAYQANATLAIVSNSCFSWGPGQARSEDVLRAAEYGGTHYETLAPLFHEDWDAVITIADYDSSWGAKAAIARQPGRVGKVLDISLVDCPTFLSECIGTIADQVEPLLIAHADSHLLNW